MRLAITERAIAVRLAGTLEVTATMADSQSYLFPVPEAAYLASLGGIEQDLRAVISFCDLLAERKPKSLNFAEWDAISSAAVVRYARCFVAGKRKYLNKNFLSTAPTELQDLHQYFMKLRHRHVAHSVNPFEENDVTLFIGSNFVSSREITTAGVHHGRVVGLPLGMPAKLKGLAQWLLLRLQEEIVRERAAIVEVAHRHELSELKAFGIPTVGGGTELENVGERRNRP